MGTGTEPRGFAFPGRILPDCPPCRGQLRVREIPHIPRRGGGCSGGELQEPGPCLDRGLIWAAGGCGLSRAGKPCCRLPRAAPPPAYFTPAPATRDGALGFCASVSSSGTAEAQSDLHSEATLVIECVLVSGVCVPDTLFKCCLSRSKLNWCLGAGITSCRRDATYIPCTPICHYTLTSLRCPWPRLLDCQVGTRPLPPEDLSTWSCLALILRFRSETFKQP